MRIDASTFRVPVERRLHLREWPTWMKPYYKSERRYEDALAGRVNELRKLPEEHYTSIRDALLLTSRR